MAFFYPKRNMQSLQTRIQHATSTSSGPRRRALLAPLMWPQTLCKRHRQRSTRTRSMRSRAPPCERNINPQAVSGPTASGRVSACQPHGTLYGKRMACFLWSPCPPEHHNRNRSSRRTCTARGRILSLSGRQQGISDKPDKHQRPKTQNPADERGHPPSIRPLQRHSRLLPIAKMRHSWQLHPRSEEFHGGVPHSRPNATPSKCGAKLDQ